MKLTIARRTVLAASLAVAATALVAPLPAGAQALKGGRLRVAILADIVNFDPAQFSSQVIRVDTIGPGQSDVLCLPWKRIPRPMYPLDPIDDWRGRGT